MSCPMITGYFIENREGVDTLQQQIEKAYAEYMRVEKDPPNMALVHPYVCEERTEIQVQGQTVIVLPSIMGRWITWIGIGKDPATT